LRFKMSKCDNANSINTILTRPVQLPAGYTPCPTPGPSPARTRSCHTTGDSVPPGTGRRARCATQHPYFRSRRLWRMDWDSRHHSTAQWSPHAVSALVHMTLSPSCCMIPHDMGKDNIKLSCSIYKHTKKKKTNMIHIITSRRTLL